MDITVNVKLNKDGFDIFDPIVAANGGNVSAIMRTMNLDETYPMNIDGVIDKICYYDEDYFTETAEIEFIIKAEHLSVFGFLIALENHKGIKSVEYELIDLPCYWIVGNNPNTHRYVLFNTEDDTYQFFQEEYDAIEEAIEATRLFDLDHKGTWEDVDDWLYTKNENYVLRKKEIFPIAEMYVKPKDSVLVC